MRLLSWSWAVAALAMAPFVIPWAYASIVLNYLVLGDFDGVLPGLGATPARRVSMGAHMVLGAVALFLGPSQFSPALRRRVPRLHRWSGRLYVASACGASLCGCFFVLLKGFKLSGGYNMGAAFLLAGGWFGVAAAMTAVRARQQRYAAHRAWAIRSYSQVLAPMLYRYWYVAATALFGYRPPREAREYPGGTCDGDTCADYFRPFDMLHAWTYWLSSVLVAELLVHALRRAPPPERALEKPRLRAHLLTGGPADTAPEQGAGCGRAADDAEDAEAPEAAAVDAAAAAAAPSAAAVEEDTSRGGEARASGGAKLAFDAAGGVVALVAIACSSAIFAAMPALPRPGSSATNATAL
mmetsp:Transcript_38113/g.122998  ORF Transcript_38113/g.122998 Transcript_38113/m.122998 type:complete len:354 (+) Transcript_38113:134-1195(+)